MDNKVQSFTTEIYKTTIFEETMAKLYNYLLHHYRYMTGQKLEIDKDTSYQDNIDIGHNFDLLLSSLFVYFYDKDIKSSNHSTFYFKYCDVYINIFKNVGTYIINLADLINVTADKSEFTWEEFMSNIN